MKIEALERALVKLLRTELQTLKSHIGQTGEWIYVDYPRLDAKMPRISLTLTSSTERPAAIGAQVGNTLGVYEETLFDIDIWIHRKNKTTGLSPTRGGTALRDFLADEIVDVCLKKRESLAADYGILDIEKTGEFVHPFDESTELFRKTITIRVTHMREY